jgi:hypothetical protein
MIGDYVGDADTQYNEWVGTCAFDDPQWESMDKVFNLPEDRYWTLGFHIFGGTGGGDELGYQATVYAVERSTVDGYDTLQTFAAENGGDVPVVEIQTTVTAETVLRTMKRWSINANRGPAVAEPQWRLRIADERDIPAEKEDMKEIEDGGGS